MKVQVRFFSYFRDLAGCEQAGLELAPSATVSDLLNEVGRQFAPLARAQGATLVAIGLEYARRDQPLHEGDEVALFPPVQGG